MIAEKDVDIVFSDAVVAQLLAKRSSDAAVVAAGIREAVHAYLALRAGTAWKNLRLQIESLYKLAEQAAQGGDRACYELAVRVAAINPVTRQTVERSVYRAVLFPTADEIRNEKTRQAAIDRLQSILSVGLKWERGRKRPNGRRSWSLKPLLRLPGLPRGRVRDVAARDLVQKLELIWLEMTGQRPPRSVNTDLASLQPFLIFVRGIFERVGIKNYEELINEREIERRIMERDESDEPPDDLPTSMEETRRAFEERHQWRKPRRKAVKDKRKKKAARAKGVRDA
jgi:hypothetical protein